VACLSADINMGLVDLNNFGFKDQIIESDFSIHQQYYRES